MKVFTNSIIIVKPIQNNEYCSMKVFTPSIIRGKSKLNMWPIFCLDFNISFRFITKTDTLSVEPFMNASIASFFAADKFESEFLKVFAT